MRARALRIPQAFRHHDFRVFWAASAVSGIGSNFSQVATAWQIYELTNSPLQIGLLGLARGVPQLGLILFGGLLADAVDRRRLMQTTQLTQFLVSTVLLVTAATGTISPTVIFSTAVVAAVASALQNPVRRAIVPNLVPREDLASAIATSRIERSFGSIAGPSIAGVVIAAAGPAWCYAVDATSMLVMMVALGIIQSRQTGPVGRRAISLNALQEGISFVWINRILFCMMVLDFNATFFGNQRALFPVFARDVFEVGPTGLGMFNSALSIGAILGAVLVNFLPKQKLAGRWVLVLMTLYGLFTCGFALAPNFAIALVMVLATGVMNTTATILRDTINQLVTPDHLRGRVSSVSSVFTSGGPQFGQFESGAVASLWGPQVSAFTGGLAAMLVVPWLLFVPAVRQFRIDHATEEANRLEAASGR